MEKTHTSRVVDADTGDSIEGVVDIQIEIDANDRPFSGIPVVTLKLIARSDFGCILEVVPIETTKKE